MRFRHFTLHWWVSHGCHHLTKTPGQTQEPQAKQRGGEGRRGGGEEGRGGGRWMNRSARVTVVENPTPILGFKVLGCKCVHSACIRFNKWLGYLVYPKWAHRQYKTVSNLHHLEQLIYIDIIFYFFFKSRNDPLKSQTLVDVLQCCHAHFFFFFLNDADAGLD